MNNKILYGQFFTISNPFNLNVFYMWLKSIPDYKNIKMLEPFAGTNNIIALINNLIPDMQNEWTCYDIEPPKTNNYQKFLVKKRDTLKNFPKGFSVAITNPPYLAKNSATKRSLEYPSMNYDDIYKYSLEVMLNNVDYVAAIIPESFITQELFHDRLYAVVSLTCKMFEDTDCPVCLAMFNPITKNPNNDFDIYRKERLLGKYSILKANIIDSNYNDINWKFNDCFGNIGIKCVDNTKSESIEFVNVNKIDKSKIKPTSRALTIVSGLPETIDSESFIKKCNEMLKIYRQNTEDVFLTSFKGLRDDGKYRRRLDYKTARNIMNNVAGEIIFKNKEEISQHD